VEDARRELRVVAAVVLNGLRVCAALGEEPLRLLLVTEVEAGLVEDVVLHALAGPDLDELQGVLAVLRTLDQLRPVDPPDAPLLRHDDAGERLAGRAVDARSQTEAR